MYLLPWAWVFCLFSISHEHKYFIFFPMSMSFLSFFYAYFKHISAYFSSTKPDFDDTSPWFMILRWYFSLHFLEKSHFAKVLNINDIILYLSRKMILWDFFEKKLFCVSVLVFLLFYNFLLKETIFLSKPAVISFFYCTFASGIVLRLGWFPRHCG